MNELVRQAAEHWSFVSPLLRKPATEADYDRLVDLLDEVLTLSEGRSDHPLSGLASAMGDLIEAYDDEHRPMPPVGGVEALRYLMHERGMKPSDLMEIGDASRILKLLDGRIPMDLEQGRALAARFSLPLTVFLAA